MLLKCPAHELWSTPHAIQAAADKAIKCEVPMRDYLAESCRSMFAGVESPRNRLCLKNHPQEVIALLEKVKVGLVDSTTPLSPSVVDLSHLNFQLA